MCQLSETQITILNHDNPLCKCGASCSLPFSVSYFAVSLSHFLSVFLTVINVYSSGTLLILQCENVLFKCASSSSMLVLIIEHMKNRRGWIQIHIRKSGSVLKVVNEISAERCSVKRILTSFSFQRTFVRLHFQLCQIHFRLSCKVLQNYSKHNVL